MSTCTYAVECVFESAHGDFKKRERKKKKKRDRVGQRPCTFALLMSFQKLDVCHDFVKTNIGKGR